MGRFRVPLRQVKLVIAEVLVVPDILRYKFFLKTLAYV